MIIQINTEKILAALLLIGYDKIDTVMLDIIYDKLNNISFTINGKTARFVINQEQEIISLNEYLDFDGFVYQYKEGLNINSIVLSIDKRMPLSKRLEYITDNILLIYLKETLNTGKLLAERISKMPGLDDEIFMHFLSTKERVYIYHQLQNQSIEYVRTNLPDEPKKF